MSHSDAPDKTRKFDLDLKGAYQNGNGGGRIQIAKWTEGYVIELDAGRRAGVVTDRESMIQLRDKLSKLLDDTKPEGDYHDGS